MYQPPKSKLRKENQVKSPRPAKTPRPKGSFKRVGWRLVGLGLLIASLVMIVWLITIFTAQPTSQANIPATPTAAAFDASAAKASLAARHNNEPAFTTAPVNSAANPAPTAPIPTVTPAGPTVAPLGQVQSQLKAAWASYRQDFIQGDGRVVDRQAGGVTTSEGQSYALLRSVWMDDRETFDRVWQWTKNNLQNRPTDKLFAYKWGQQADGSWKVLDPNAATDADSDISLALILAARHWNVPAYQQSAAEVLTSLWNQTVVQVRGKPYLTAGDWGPGQAKPGLNPSYLSPYAYRIFAQVDPAHNWNGLVDTSYEIIRACSELPLDTATSAKLPANWCGIDKATGQFTTAQDYPRLDTHYGYDAFRTMWRVALDYRWNNEPRALDYLKWSDTLRQKWSAEGRLLAEYDHAGQPLQNHEDLAVYGGDLANFVLTDPAQADRIVSQKILPTFFQTADNHAGWGDGQVYYSQNWVWFGLALYANALPAPATPLAQAAAPSTNPTAGPVTPAALNSTVLTPNPTGAGS